MKIHEITEAKKPVTLGGTAMRVKQRIDPKLTNMMTNVSSYRQEIEKLKNTNLPSLDNKKVDGRKNPWQFTRDTREVVTFQNIGLSLMFDDIDIWKKYQEEDFIFDETMGRLRSKNIPDQLYSEMRQDPQWQEAVRQIWNYAVIAMDKGENEKATGSIFQIAGIDIKDVRNTEKQIVDIFHSYLKKFGIDKTGRKMIYR